ncbi:MAG: hypothetical protein KAI70_02510 [Candidatus Omnitrophica bacterium]|nr:hypothetical protein [Candidatus Omnitrophota bacterium]
MNDRMSKIIAVIFIIVLSTVSFSKYTFSAGVSTGNDMMVGIPFGGEENLGYDLCPQGMSVIGMFMSSWKRNDYRSMYELLDEDCKADYLFEDAKFDFQFLEFKEYRISSVRRNGDNFEFMLSSGDYRDGDKDVTKMTINGETFRIIMLTRHSPFKKSADSYF